MIPELNGTLKQLLYERGGISPIEVDVRFEAPTREWIERLTRPTINLFLCDIEENAKMRPNGVEMTRVNGRSEKRRPPKRIDLRYMVSALSTETEDEQRLLWRVLGTLLANPELPEDLMPDDVRALGLPVPTTVAQPDDRLNVLEIWGGLGVEPRSALSYTVTVPLDVSTTIFAPLVLTRTIRLHSTLDEDGPPSTQVGVAGVVRRKDGEVLPDVRVSVVGSAQEASVTDTDGRFRLRHVIPGPMTLRVEQDGTEQTVEFTVPSENYDVVLK